MSRNNFFIATLSLWTFSTSVLLASDRPQPATEDRPASAPANVAKPKKYCKRERKSCHECEQLRHSCHIILGQLKLSATSKDQLQKLLQSDTAKKRNDLVSTIVAHADRHHHHQIKSQCLYCRTVLIGEHDDKPSSLACYHLSFNARCAEDLLEMFQAVGLEAIERFGRQ